MNEKEQLKNKKIELSFNIDLIFFCEIFFSLPI
jgi:hypothetical protein